MKIIINVFIAIALVVGLVVGIAGCIEPGPYDLTMAENPVIGGTATDLTGTSPYAQDTLVDIQAVPAANYQFCKWTAPAGTFVDADNPTTKFKMPGQNVTVTANFVGPLDHFKCYGLEAAEPLGIDVSLRDQWVSIDATVESPVVFANPTDKIVYEPEEQTLRWNLDHHLVFYLISYEESQEGQWFVQVENQFGTYNLTVEGPHALAVPTQKVEPQYHEEPMCLNHYLVYDVIYATQLEEGITVGLKDEFGDDPEVDVLWPVAFAIPAEKTVDDEVTEITTDEHLLFYLIEGCEQSCDEVQVVNQFNEDEQTLQTFYLDGPAGLLAVPSWKIDWEEMIDHFKCYFLPGELQPIGEVVGLKDQFVDVSANVTTAQRFCNPAGKWGVPTLNDDHHFMIYWLSDVPTNYYGVTVSNQFNYDEPEELTVFGPVALAVPTQKLAPYYHDPPQGSDHYLLYSVEGEPTPLDIGIGLADEFGSEPEGVIVRQATYFANPVQKTHGTTIDIKNDLAHLVLYTITGGLVGAPTVQVDNQFYAAPTDYYDLFPDMLAVPSLKLEVWEPLF